MITLFHRPKTRSPRFIFLLEELEAPYQIKLGHCPKVSTGPKIDQQVTAA
jgi:hypothetical protein